MAPVSSPPPPATMRPLLWAGCGRRNAAISCGRSSGSGAQLIAEFGSASGAGAAAGGVVRIGTGRSVNTVVGAGGSERVYERGISGGSGASTLVGGAGDTLMMANGAAPDLIVAGAGATAVDGTTGSGGVQIFAGADVYGFVNGHAGGTVIIDGLKTTDTIVFAGYAGDPIAAEGVVQGSDLITFQDGTNSLLLNVDHPIFK